MSKLNGYSPDLRDTMARDSIKVASQLVKEMWSTRLYEELHQLAASQMARQSPGQTLQATALVHEAWLKLGGSHQHWQNRAHFFGAAAQAMRQILIDQARRKAAVRHGGGQERVELTESKIIGGSPGRRPTRATGEQHCKRSKRFPNGRQRDETVVCRFEGALKTSWQSHGREPCLEMLKVLSLSPKPSKIP
jgi:ECF sigma factor